MKSSYKTIVTVPWSSGNEWLMAGQGGPRVGNPQTAYAIIPLLYRATKLRVDSLSRLPVYVYKGNQEVKVWPFEKTLKLKEFIRKTELAMLLRGGSFTVKLKNEYGMDVGLQWLNPFFVVVWLDGETLMFSYSIAGQTYPMQNRQWPQDEMVYWREFNTVNDIQPGVAPASVALLDAQISFNVTQFLQQFFEHGAMPATVAIVPEGTADEPKRELESWLSRKITGLKNAWRAIAVKGEVKFEKLTPEINTFTINRVDDHSIECICHAFDIPITILRAGSANRATAEVEYANFLQHTIIPRAGWYEENINDLLSEYPGDYHVEFAPDELPEMQEDEQRRSLSFLNYAKAGVPLDVAADILNIELTDEMRKRLGSIGPRHPIEVIEPEVKAELGRYERKAIKSLSEGHAAKVEFRSEIIPERVLGRLDLLLRDAKTEKDVKKVFHVVTNHELVN